MVTKSTAQYAATGRRKTSVARVRLVNGVGKLVVNGRSGDEYFPLPTLHKILAQPFEVTGTQDRFDVLVLVNGGGLTGQAGAIRHGVSRALLEVDPSYRTALKQAGYLTRDPRMKERKKPGQPGARKRFQFSKR